MVKRCWQRFLYALIMLLLAADMMHSINATFTKIGILQCFDLLLQLPPSLLTRPGPKLTEISLEFLLTLQHVLAILRLSREALL